MKIIIEFRGETLEIEKVNGQLLAMYDNQIVIRARTWDSMMQQAISAVEEIERSGELHDNLMGKGK